MSNHDRRKRGSKKPVLLQVAGLPRFGAPVIVPAVDVGPSNGRCIWETGDGAISRFPSLIHTMQMSSLESQRL